MPKGEEITTRFRVDVSDLKSGISEANQQIKLANAEFKAATAGMDDWSKSADGIKAKLAQLESVLSAQKTKLEAYNEQLSRQQKAYDENGRRAAELRAKLEELAENGVEKTSKEYKNYENALAACEKEQESNKKSLDSLKITVLDQQAAVNKTEAEIGKYTSSLEDLENGADEADKETTDLSKSVKESGKNAEDSAGGFSVLKGALADLVASGIKAAIQGLKDLANAAVDAWDEFDDGRDTVIRMTGATGDMADSLTTSYGNLSKRIVASSGDIGKAIGEVSTRFDITGDELENLSERFLQFSEITGTDVVGAVDDTQKAMSAYGLSVEDADGFLDILAATSQKTGVSTSALTSGLISNATAFQEMGLSVDQAVSFMGMLEKSGSNSETVLNGMRKALKNSAADGMDLNEALIALQDSIENNESSVDGLNAAYDMFGKSGDQIYGAIANGTLSFRDLSAAADDASGTVENTFNATKDASDDFELALQNLKVTAAETIDKFLQDHGPQIEELMQKVSETLLPAVTKALDGVMKAVEWIMNNLDWLAPLVGIFGGIAAAIGLVTAAQTALNAVMAANPIGLVVTAIAALVAAFVYLWNNCEEFREFWINLWEKIKEVASAVWGAITKFFSEAWDKIQKTFANVGDWFKKKFEAARDGIKNAWSKMGEWATGVKNNVQNAFSNIGDWFKDKFTAAKEGLQKAFEPITSFFQKIWDGIKKIFDPVSDFFGDAFDRAKQAVAAPMNWIIRGLNTLIRGINKISFDVPDWVPGIGGKTLGFDIPEIPELARGGILRRGQTGFLEGSGAEAVIPLDQNKMWIHSVASDLLRQIQTANGGSVTNIGGAKDYNFTQIINAPKAPSRIEIYRQTRNLLSFAKATAGGT